MSTWIVWNDGTDDWLSSGGGIVLYFCPGDFVLLAYSTFFNIVFDECRSSGSIETLTNSSRGAFGTRMTQIVMVPLYQGLTTCLWDVDLPIHRSKLVAVVIHFVVYFLGLVIFEVSPIVCQSSDLT